MTAKRKKKKPSLPKPRHVWEIKPGTRVKPSEKIYRRSDEKKKKPAWIDSLDWFGDKD